MLQAIRNFFRSNYELMDAPALMYARVRYDTTRPCWGFVSRTSPQQVAQPRVRLIQAPCTCRANGGTGSTKLPMLFQKLLQRLNSAAAFKYLKRKASGYVNIQAWPVVQDVLFGGALVKITEIVGNRAYIATMSTKAVPAPVTYEMHPWLVHQFSVIDPQGETWKSPKGDAFVIVASKVRMYVPLEDLELFPMLPFPVTVCDPDGLVMYDAPSGNQTGVMIYPETTVTIAEYAFRGPNVWGRLKGGEGWVPLGNIHEPGYFTTSWNMATVPIW